MAQTGMLALLAQKEEVEMTTHELEAVSTLKSLCASWRVAGDPDTFAQIIKTCLDGQVITPSQFRDALALLPTTPSDWASGAVKPHRLKQGQVVSFVENRIGS